MYVVYYLYLIKTVVIDVADKIVAMAVNGFLCVFLNKQIQFYVLSKVEVLHRILIHLSSFFLSSAL